MVESLHLYFSENLFFSDSRNPFVEHAIQYAIAAAHLASDKDKEALHKLFLQGNLQKSLLFHHFDFWSGDWMCNYFSKSVLQVLISQSWAPMTFTHIGIRCSTFFFAENRLNYTCGRFLCKMLIILFILIDRITWASIDTRISGYPCTFCINHIKRRGVKWW